MRTWNMIVGLGCFAGMSFGLAACGGFSNLGDGVAGEGGGGGDTGTMTGGSGGKSMGSGGTMTPGTGGSMNPGAGGTMTPGAGGTMTPGTGGSMNPGAGGTMAPGAGGTMTPGAGGTMTPGSGGTGGIQTTDCSTLPCGSMCIGHDHPMGPPVEFFSGYCGDDAECHREAVECAPPQACMTTEECLLLPFLPECTMCADGEVACAKLDCVMGECAVIPPSCRSTQCENVECGTACACPDGQMCPDGAMIFATCNADGQCQAGQAECGGTCMTSMDCPQLLICAECGNGFCATNLCYGGRCEMVCPMPTADTCETSMDCPPPPPSCEMCPNGSCAGTSCIEGTCVFGCESE